MSNDYVQLSQVSLGTELIAPVHTLSPHNPIEPVWVIGRHLKYEYIVIGWNGRGGFPISNWISFSGIYEFDSSIENCTRGKEFDPATLFILRQKAIKHPAQKCAVCQLPAPHADPNTENGYVCSSCIVLSGLK